MRHANDIDDQMRDVHWYLEAEAAGVSELVLQLQLTQKAMTRAMMASLINIDTAAIEAQLGILANQKASVYCDSLLPMSTGFEVQPKLFPSSFKVCPMFEISAPNPGVWPDQTIGVKGSGGRLDGIVVMMSDTSHGQSMTMAHLAGDLSEKGILFIDHEEFKQLSIESGLGKTGVLNEIFDVKLIEHKFQPLDSDKRRPSRAEKEARKRKRGW